MRQLLFSGLVLVAGLLAGACSDRVPLPSTPTPTPAPSPEATGPETPTTVMPTRTPRPTPTPTPAVTIGGLEPVPLTAGDPVSLPSDVALIVETGCWQCDGPTMGFLRVYRDPSGVIRTETLSTAGSLGLPPTDYASHIWGFAMTNDASDMVVTICTQGDCGWMGLPSDDAMKTLFRSTDGGVTWVKYGDLPAGDFLTGDFVEGWLLVGRYEGSDPPVPSWRLVPGDEPVIPPEGATAEWQPAVIGRDILWLTPDGRVVDGAGSELLETGGDLRPGWNPFSARPGEGGSLLLHSDVYHRDHMALVDAKYRVDAVYSLPEIHLGVWLSDSVAAGNALESGDFDWPAFPASIPVLIDTGEAEIHPIAEPFLDPAFLGGRNLIRAALHGPFARVVNTGSCLNVRADAGVDAPVVACAADGVLLRHTGETQEADRHTWLHVVTPSGAEGWASAAYLEY